MQKLRPDLDIGNNIRSMRIGKKLSQDEVVAKLQLMGLIISRSTYAKIETNRMNIRISELKALKIIFNVDYNDFFEGI
ncbi:MAG: helix-turn-helix domain-containing protein [Defluviitaleaceae bacterium]|nr:helix-turn-helix domain-containing protein [Defluviitaleaceae bacterium]